MPEYKRGKWASLRRSLHYQYLRIAVPASRSTPYRTWRRGRYRLLREIARRRQMRLVLNYLLPLLVLLYLGLLGAGYFYAPNPLIQHFCLFVVASQVFVPLLFDPPRLEQPLPPPALLLSCLVPAGLIAFLLTIGLQSVELVSLKYLGPRYYRYSRDITLFNLVVLGLNWLLASFFLYRLGRKRSRREAFVRIAKTLVFASLLQEVLLLILAMGTLDSSGTSWYDQVCLAAISGGVVLFWALGLAILLLLMQGQAQKVLAARQGPSTLPKPLPNYWPRWRKAIATPCQRLRTAFRQNTRIGRAWHRQRYRQLRRAWKDPQPNRFVAILLWMPPLLYLGALCLAQNFLNYVAYLFYNPTIPRFWENIPYYHQSNSLLLLLPGSLALFVALLSYDGPCQAMPRWRLTLAVLIPAFFITSLFTRGTLWVKSLLPAFHLLNSPSPHLLLPRMIYLVIWLLSARLLYALNSGLPGWSVLRRVLLIMFALALPEMWWSMNLYLDGTNLAPPAQLLQVFLRNIALLWALGLVVWLPLLSRHRWTARVRERTDYGEQRA